MTPTAPPQLPLILASQSPSRASLLREAGIAFTQQSPPFADPDQPEHDSPHSLPEAEQYAVALAKQKALSMVQSVAEPSLILAADTLCVSMRPGSEGELIGKPRDRADAEAMLRRFMDDAHAVVTGAVLMYAEANAETPPTSVAASLRDAGALPTPANCIADTTIVTLGQVPDTDLQHYLDSKDWQGKAGGYNLFDREGAGWPLTVQGDPSTVVGLPMQKLIPAISTMQQSPR